MLGSASGRQRLYWRPWPCSICGGGNTPIGHLVGSGPASSVVRAESPEAVAVIQGASLLEWARRCNHHSPVVLDLPKLAEGSEHLVFLDEFNSKVVKFTRTGLYGESYFLVDGMVNQRNCSPLDYLLRLRLWKKLFKSAPRDVGITDAGQIVSSHEFIPGVPPTQGAVDAFLFESGLSPVKQERWLWKRVYPEFEIWVGDARLDNFVSTVAGIVPIDIRVWFSNRIE